MGTKGKQKKPYKWSFAIGTTSRVPGTQNRLHYLILDIDTKEKEKIKEVNDAFDHVPCQMRWFETDHGWHVFTDFIADLQDCCIMAKKLGADPKWIEIAHTRGYFYLADKEPVFLNWPVERMIIYNAEGQRQAQHTGRT